ncbi:hypothetical protein A1332_08360 [Methylomonas methanica]|uniref:Uncharacterized protein n=1 Tax=Methylomonas methanica TaxID=421 RepID=A0A177MQI2_METMH|nr:hypothetical protein A1332_08360 [Methylomonas methanica]
MIVSVSLQVARDRANSESRRASGFRDSENAPKNQKEEDDIYTIFRFFGGRLEAPTRKNVHMSCFLILKNLATLNT